MNFRSPQLGQRAFTPHKVVVSVAIAAAAAVAIASAVTHPPSPIIIGLVVVIPVGLAALIWPDLATLAVVFIVYTNAAVVAVKFHGVPFIVGASVPVLLALPLANYLVFQRQPLIITPAFPLIILYLVVQGLGTLFADNIGIAAETLQEFLMEGVVLYFLITNVVRTPQVLRRAIWVLLLAGAVMGGLTLFQQLTGTHANNYGGFGQVSNGAFGTGVETLQGEVTQRRLSGPIGEQNRFAQIMLMLVPLGIFRLWGERSALLRLLAAGATALAATGTALTFSRGAAAAFVMLLIIMSFMRYIKLRQVVVVLLAGLLLLQAIPQYRARLNTFQGIVNVFRADSSGINEADSSTRSRVTEVLAALLVFADHPLVGVGPGMFGQHYETYAEIVGIRVKYGRARRPHSLFPDIAAENGALGLLCFLGILLVTLRDAIRVRPLLADSDPELANMVTAFMLAIISYLLTGLFLHFAYIRYFWLMLALTHAASYMAGQELAKTHFENEPPIPGSSLHPVGVRYQP